MGGGSRLALKLLVAGVVTLWAGSVMAQTMATLTDIGTLIGPDGYSEGYGISGDGSVVVGETSFSDTDPFSEHAFKWTSTAGMLDLGTLLPDNDGISQAWATSNDGAVIVGESNYTESELDAGAEHAVYWDGTGIHDLGTLVGPTGNSHATATSTDGSVIVGDSNFTGGQPYEFQAALWKNGTITNLGTLAGGAESESTAWGVDADGGVVVGQSDAVLPDNSTVVHAFIWTPADGMQDLGTDGDSADYTAAYAVDAAGDVIVGVSGNDAFRWTSAGMVDLGNLAPPGSLGTSEAYGVSGDGAVVVGTSGGAFRWTAGTGMQYLSTLLASAGVDMTDIELGTAQAASYNGQYITGIGTFSSDSDNERAYIVRFCGGDDPVSCTSSGGGGGGGGGGGPPIGGVTTPESVQASVDQVSAERFDLSAWEDAAADALLGVGQPITSDTAVGIYGDGGTGWGTGAFGRLAIEDGLSVAGGLAFDDEEGPAGTEGRGGLAAFAFRYLHPSTGSWHPFAEAGGWTGFDGRMRFSRTYMNGAGTALGEGETDGSASSVFARAGVDFTAGSADDAAVWGELGRQWINTSAYAEALSPDNPFNADFSDATGAMDVAKLGVQWTHTFTPKLSDTVWAAAAVGFNSSTNLVASVAGLGDFSPGPSGSLAWAEFGARVSYRTAANRSLDLFGGGIAGGGGIGVGLRAGIALVAQL